MLRKNEQPQQQHIIWSHNDSWTIDLVGQRKTRQRFSPHLSATATVPHPSREMRLDIVESHKLQEAIENQQKHEHRSCTNIVKNMYENQGNYGFRCAQLQMMTLRLYDFHDALTAEVLMHEFRHHDWHGHVLHTL